jgi:hypothetical protein
MGTSLSHLFQLCFDEMIKTEAFAIDFVLDHQIGELVNVTGSL